MTELRFDDRVAIVTGAGRGIGRAHAHLLASRGAQVVVADLGCAMDGTGSSPDPADKVVGEIEANGGVAVASHATVADEGGAASIVASALKAFGRIDVLINNAGIFAPRRSMPSQSRSSTRCSTCTSSARCSSPRPHGLT